MAGQGNQNEIQVNGLTYQNGGDINDGFVESRTDTILVIPAKAGIQSFRRVIDSDACPGFRSGFRRSVGFQDFLRGHHQWYFHKYYPFFF